jgi:hypothetical protein
MQCLFIKVPKSENVNYSIKNILKSSRWKERDVGEWFPVLRLNALR